MRKVILSWTLLLGLVGVFQPAKAEFRGGICVLSMHFSFSPPLKFGSAPAGDKTWILDYNSTAAGCVVSPTQVGDPLIRTTWGHIVGQEGNGNGLTWTCETFIGVAPWFQQFDPAMIVPIANATLVLSIGQGATIVLSSNNTSFQGIIDIASAPPVAQCNGSGLDVLNATGVMEFHDPDVPQ